MNLSLRFYLYSYVRRILIGCMLMSRTHHGGGNWRQDRRLPDQAIESKTNLAFSQKIARQQATCHRENEFELPKEIKIIIKIDSIR